MKDSKISRRNFFKKSIFTIIATKISLLNFFTIFPGRQIIIPKNWWKRLYASLFGVMEIPILQEFMKIRKEKGEKYAFDKLENMAKEAQWGTKVVPISESIKSNIKVLPSEEIREIVRRSKVKMKGECWCRTNFKNCNKPTNTCLLLSFAEDRTDLVNRGFSSQISEKEIDELLNAAEEAGLVHQLIYAGDKDIFYVICNCCPCCCVGLQALIKYGKNIVERSDFVAKTDKNSCVGCGICFTRCYFEARKQLKNKTDTIKDKCFGCGLCSTKCPANAIKLIRR